MHASGWTNEGPSTLCMNTISLLPKVLHYMPQTSQMRPWEQDVHDSMNLWIIDSSSVDQFGFFLTWASWRRETSRQGERCEANDIGRASPPASGPVYCVPIADRLTLLCPHCHISGKRERKSFHDPFVSSASSNKTQDGETSGRFFLSLLRDSIVNFQLYTYAIIESIFLLNERPQSASNLVFTTKFVNSNDGDVID